jgi:hypothetical protein
MKKNVGNVESGPVEDSFMGSLPHLTETSAEEPYIKKAAHTNSWTNMTVDSIVVVGRLWHSLRDAQSEAQFAVIISP